MYLAVQEGTGGEHHRPPPKSDADLGHSAHHPVAFDHEVVDRLLEKGEVGLVFQHPADGCLVEDAVGLGAGGAYRRPLGAVENAELDAALVRGQRHRAAKRVHLFDQMALADAADRRVAGHLTQGLDVVGEQQGLAAHPGRGQRSLGAGMAATDDDDVEFLGVQHVRPQCIGFAGRPPRRRWLGGDRPSRTGSHELPGLIRYEARPSPAGAKAPWP